MYSVAIVGKDRQDARELEKGVEWRTAGCHVAYTWSNGSEAWGRLRQVRPDILVTELCLSDMNGLDLIKRKNEMVLSSQTIIVTDIADFASAQKAIELEVAGYVLKPVSKEEMQVALSCAIRRLEQSRRNMSFEQEQGELAKILEKIWKDEESYSPLVRQSLLYIDRHIYEQSSLSSLCEYLGLTPPYISRIFKEEVGVGYATYVRMCKMSEAEKLLKLPGNKPGQVAKLLGYHNYSYFYQVFKNQFGKGPAGYSL